MPILKTIESIRIRLITVKANYENFHYAFPYRVPQTWNTLTPIHSNRQQKLTKFENGKKEKQKKKNFQSLVTSGYPKIHLSTYKAV